MFYFLRLMQKMSNCAHEIMKNILKNYLVSADAIKIHLTDKLQDACERR